MTTHRTSLGIVDYVLLAIMLLISSGIGIYFRFSGDKQKTTKEYLLAGKNMSILPVAFSLMASYLSAITIVGVPAEMYHFGIYMLYMNLSYLLGMIMSAYITLPVFFQMQAATSCEYLEVRFGKVARVLTSFGFLVQLILFMSVVLYAPAIALSAVTNLEVWVSVISVGVVCTFYCTLGGMKAVLWTDVFQALLMFTGLFAVMIAGFLSVGFVNAFTIAFEGGRIVVPTLDTSFYTRYTAWNVLCQGVVLSMSSYGVNQVQVQRFLTVRSLSRSRKAFFISMPLSTFFHFFACVAGLIVYAYFSRCDPLKSPNHPITKGDQLLPYFMMISLRDYPGLPGLCICGIFSASLSSISSAINSLTAVTMQDLVRPFLEAKGFSQKHKAVTAQAITLFYGFLCIGLTFVVAAFGNLVQAALIVFGILGGPILGLFLLGMLTIRANEKGAVLGFLVGILMSFWIGFGAAANGRPPQVLPTTTEGCPPYNASVGQSSFPLTTWSPRAHAEFELKNSSQFVTEESAKIIKNLASKPDDRFLLYRISFMWITTMGFVLTFIVGYTASVFVNIISGETKDVAPELISPVIKRFIIKKSELEKKEKDQQEPRGIQMETNGTSVQTKTSKNAKDIIDTSKL